MTGHLLGRLVSEPLVSLLRPDEHILHVGHGRLLVRLELSLRRWNVTVTDQRVIFTRDEAKGRRVVEYERSSITSAEHHAGFAKSKVVMNTDRGTVVVDGMSRDSASALAAVILRDPRKVAMSENLNTSAGLSLESHEAILDRLERLEAEVEELRAQIRFMEAIPKRIGADYQAL